MKKVLLLQLLLASSMIVMAQKIEKYIDMSKYKISDHVKELTNSLGDRATFKGVVYGIDSKNITPYPLDDAMLTVVAEVDSTLVCRQYSAEGGHLFPLGVLTKKNHKNKRIKIKIEKKGYQTWTLTDDPKLDEDVYGRVYVVKKDSVILVGNDILGL